MTLMQRFSAWRSAKRVRVERATEEGRTPDRSITNRAVAPNVAPPPSRAKAPEAPGSHRNAPEHSAKHSAKKVALAVALFPVRVLWSCITCPSPADLHDPYGHAEWSRCAGLKA